MNSYKEVGKLTEEREILIQSLVLRNFTSVMVLHLSVLNNDVQYFHWNNSIFSCFAQKNNYIILIKFRTFSVQSEQIYSEVNILR